MVWSGTLDSTHRKVNLPVLVVTVLMLTVLLLVQSLYVGRHRLNILAVTFDAKNVRLTPRALLADFMARSITF